MSKINGISGNQEKKLNSEKLSWKNRKYKKYLEKKMRNFF